MYNVHVVYCICKIVAKNADYVMSRPAGYRITYNVQGIPAFLDFTIRDPLYFVIQLQASIHDFEEKIQKKIQIFFFFGNFFGKISDFQLLWIAFQLYKVFAITQTLRIPT